MNVNKKLDRLKQWAGEKMGGEVKTNVSDDFKMLEVEMGLRYEGMKENQRAMTTYVKSLSKRNEFDEKEKVLPVALLGNTMVNHGDDFENDSEFGQCLIAMGRTNERIARNQDTYVTNATSSWLESLERSLAQMKEYQAARKKLESRRLAYDAALAKMEKAKKEDFRVEEELRAQKAKYEESSEDVYRRMQDIKEAELDSIADLGDFLEAELTYYDRCREILLQVKKDWPAGDIASRKSGRSRSNTAHSYADRYSNLDEEPEPAPPVRPSIKSNRAASSSVPQSPRRELPGFDLSSSRPAINRATTFEGPTQLHRDSSPSSGYQMSRTPSESLSVRGLAGQPRTISRVRTANSVFDDYPDKWSNHASGTNSPDTHSDDGSPLPTLPYRNGPQRVSSGGMLSTLNPNAKKAPPPPPPSRAKKPPPPPPMKRTMLSASDVHYA